MLNYFKENDLVLYSQEQPATWEEAIRISCEKLLEKELITEQYVDEIIKSVNTHGPYIVIVPQVAMPHAQPDSESVLGTGISFTKFPEEIQFYDEEYEEDKPASLFFTLAAKDSEAHLENIANLIELLEDEELCKKLLETDTLEDFDQLVKEND